MDSQTSEERHGASAYHALTNLARLAQRRDDARRWLEKAFEGRAVRLAELTLDVAIETGDPIGQILAQHIERHPPAEVERLLKLCSTHRYRISVPLREVGLGVTKAVLEARRAGRSSLDDRQKAAMAQLVHNLTYWLAATGRQAEALVFIQQAARDFRELARVHPQRYHPGLAMCRMNESNYLAAFGRRQEALEAVRESVRLYRLLCRFRRRRYLPELARCLHIVPCGSARSGIGIPPCEPSRKLSS